MAEVPQVKMGRVEMTDDEFLAFCYGVFASYVQTDEAWYPGDYDGSRIFRLLPMMVMVGKLAESSGIVIQREGGFERVGHTVAADAVRQIVQAKGFRYILGFGWSYPA